MAATADGRLWPGFWQPMPPAESREGAPRAVALFALDEPLGLGTFLERHAPSVTGLGRRGFGRPGSNRAARLARREMPQLGSTVQRAPGGAPPAPPGAGRAAEPAVPSAVRWPTLTRTRFPAGVSARMGARTWFSAESAGAFRATEISHGWTTTPTRPP